jgi:AP-1-like transcription factor
MPNLLLLSPPQLEDKVAELEAKNLTSETENQHLKDLLKRLQDENVAFRNSAFTFTAPRNGEPSDGSFSNTVPSFASSPTSVFASTSHLPSPPSTVAKASSPQSPSLDTPSAFPGDIDFGSLTPLDASLTLLDDSDAIMAYDFGYGQFVPPAKTPYKTIASNPMFMSFADPSTTETALASKSSAQSPNQNGGNPYDVTFGQWTGQTSAGSLDELFGGNMFSTQAPINFNALMKNSVTSPVTSAMSPVAHQSVPSSSNGPSSSSSPSFEPSDASSPPAAPGSHGDGCPKTRAQMEKHIQAAGSSMFAPPPSRETESPTVPFKAPAGAEGPMIICKDATFPKTEQSDKNIEVLAAWKSITSHPIFKGSVSNHVPQHILSSLFAYDVHVTECRHERAMF